MVSSLRKRNVHAALCLLADAYECAQETQKDVWDFAVELSRLRLFGLDDTDFRWLTSMGLVQHRLESTLPGDVERVFHAAGLFKFEERSCFVLTPKGVENAHSVSDSADGRAGQHGFGDVTDPVAPETVGRGAARNAPIENIAPHWDCERRELRMGDQLVKQFRRPAPHQEAILSAFQEDGWSPSIADPLSPAADVDPKRRLNDAIKSLNRNQLTPMLRFMGDGTGEGVIWKSAEINDRPISIRTNE